MSGLIYSSVAHNKVFGIFKNDLIGKSNQNTKAEK